MPGSRANDGLPGTRFTDVRWVEEVDSTNTLVLAEARGGAPEGLVVVADHQTSGRGRHGRSWEAPPGSSLLVSVLLRPSLPVGRAHLATAAAALAMADACGEVAGILPALKWPNDLVIEEPGGYRKLAGVLAESDLDGPRLAAVVVGVGCNVNWPHAAPPGGVALNELRGADVDRRTLLRAFLRCLERHRAALDSPSDADSVAAEYRRRCVTLGREVRVDLGAGQFTGRAEGVSGDGHLGVRLASGELRWVAAGDVAHLRPLQPD